MDEPREKIRIVIVEDEGLFRDLLRIALSRHPSLEVVGTFPDGESALEAAPALRPRAALLDIELGSSLNGIQVGLRLRQLLPDLGIVLLSNHGDINFLTALSEEAIGGWSYLLKKSVSDVETLTRAVEGATGRLVVLDPQLVALRRPRAGGLLDRLSPRQREILNLLAEGFTNTAIAKRLVLAEKSVENQINLLYHQLAINRQDSSLHPRVKAVLLYLQETQTGGSGVFPS
ncbi:MAG: response regulator transcription factor [Chloroflexi bacterium]|nr:response regulator transcription factor [Chloroflexota bacterium]